MLISKTQNKQHAAVPHEKRRKKRGVVEIVAFSVFLLYALFLLFPLAWALMNSLKTRIEYLESVVALPQQWLFSNYLRAFKVLDAGGKNAFTMLLNSLWLSAGKPTIKLLTAVMASYVMARYKFPGRSIIWGIMITVMVIPIYGATASTYKMYQLLNIFDSPLILITSVSGIGGSIMLIAAFEGVSPAYAEAGFIEGAGHFRILWQLVLPQVSGLLAALWIMDFITEWNSYMWPIMYMPSYITLSSGLYWYQIEQGRALDTPILFAGSFISIVPVVALFIAFQDKFLNLSYGSGVKG